jgi:hypothetical protein
MTSDELQLFDMIDNARVNNGCARLEQDPDLTLSARSDARSRSRSTSNLNDGSSSMSAAGGDDFTAQQAFNKMMSQSRSTILNCGLTTLAVGRGTTEYCKVPVLCLTGTTDRNAWVADFT